MSLPGKRVVILSPEFFGYGRAIATELEHMGARVRLYDTRPDNSISTKLLLRLAPNLLTNRVLRYHQKILERTDPNQDFILVIRGEGLTSGIMQHYRKHYSNAKFIYYNYDALSENPVFFQIRDYFDVCYSFDPVDADKQPNLYYQTLFYLPQYAKKSVGDAKNFDIAFVGTFRLSRYKSIQKILQALPNSVRPWLYFYHPNRFIFNIFYPILSIFGVNRDYIYFDALSPEEIRFNISKSSAVIDIQKPHQRGLTIRTFEMLAMEKKLITTNKNVIRHDFYDPNNILVLNENTKLIPGEFFETPYRSLKPEIYQYYSLHSWIERVLKP